MSQDNVKIDAAIHLALEHIRLKGLDDVFRPPSFAPQIEMKIINENFDEFSRIAKLKTRKFIKTNNLEADLIGSVFYSMTPKDHYSYRRVCWIDPFDLVKYLTLALLVFPEIESNRLPKNRDIVHSHRKSDDNDKVFDEKYGYDSFRKKSSDMTRERVGQWKVVTDISNFYDRIGNHPLENSLINCGCKIEYVTLLREILFFWAGDRRSFGVPVGSDASRILSEAALIGIDKSLYENGIAFTRYVDDYRLFAKDRATAYAAMLKLSELLAQEGLSANHKKTNIYKIMDEEDPQDNLNAKQSVVPNSQNDSHEPINLDERIKIEKRVVVSGRSSISKIYKEPGKEAVAKLRLMDKNTLIKDFISSSGQNQEDVMRKLVKYFIHIDQDERIIRTLLEEKITTIVYIVDALVKNEKIIPNQLKASIKDLIFDSSDALLCPYPFQIPLLRLYSIEGYSDSRLSAAIVDNHRTMDSQQFFREAILLGFGQIDRDRIKKLSINIFPNLSNLVKRAIIYALCNSPNVTEDEKRPIKKNLLRSSDDWFVRKIGNHLNSLPATANPTPTPPHSPAPPPQGCLLAK